jgi:hypothetical protein
MAHRIPVPLPQLVVVLQKIRVRKADFQEQSQYPKNEKFHGRTQAIYPSKSANRESQSDQ